jgi:TonB family protein
MKSPKVALGLLILGCFLAVLLAKTEEPTAPSLEPAEVVSSVNPVYPAMAIGPETVVVVVSIDEKGDIQNVKATPESGGFTRSALDAIKGWKFKPARLDGKPIPSVVPVAFSFSWPFACLGQQR